MENKRADEKHSLSGISSCPKICPLKEIFEAICRQRWRGQISEQESSHAGQPRPQWMDWVRFTSAFLSLNSLQSSIQIYSALHFCLLIHLSSICNFCMVSVLIQLIGDTQCLCAFLPWRDPRVQSELKPPAKRWQILQLPSLLYLSADTERYRINGDISDITHIQQEGFCYWEIRQKCLIYMMSHL